MATPGLYFAIYYQVDDRAFQRAAMTWGVGKLGGVCQAQTPFLMELVSTVADFRRAWETIAKQSSDLGKPIVEGAVFSHASKGSQNDGLEFRKDGSEDGTLAQAEISALPKLTWANEGRLILHGCNSGLAGTRGWAPASAFAAAQGVKTIGQAGYAYFSTSETKYSEINANCQTVYLWAYKRGKNGALGSGERMAGIPFGP